MITARIPFAGFYCSIWDDITTQYVEREDERLDDQSISDHMDYRQAHEGIAKLYAEAFAEWLAETIEQPVEYEFDELTSPRYYNFETDRIFVRFPDGVMQAVLDDLRAKDNETLEQTFRDYLTSRDGFISFYSSDVPTKPITEWDHNELYVLLEAWVAHRLQGHGGIDHELYEGVYEQADAVCEAAVDWSKIDANSACNT